MSLVTPSGMLTAPSGTSLIAPSGIRPGDDGRAMIPNLVSGNEIAAMGLWLDVHVHRDGDLLNMDVYTCKGGQPRVFHASVDMRPIAKAVKSYHELLHASTKVSGMQPGDSREAVSANIRELIAAGYPQKQAVAIALQNAGLSRIGCAAVNGEVVGCKLVRVGAGGPGTRTITDYDTLFSVMGKSRVQADILDEDMLGVIVGCCGMTQAAKVAGELNVGWNPFKAASKLVKDIGKAKLVKQITSQVKAAATSPIVSKALSGAAMINPLAATAATVLQTARVAANVDKARGNILKAGVLTMQQAVRDNDPQAAVNAMTKALPPKLRAHAEPIVNKVFAETLSKVPGGDLAKAGQGLLMKITSEALPTDVKDIAKSAVKAGQILAKSAPQVATAAVLPKVSDKAMAYYATAERGLAAMEQAGALRSAAKTVLSARQALPVATGTLVQRTQQLRSNLPRINALPPAARQAAMQQYTIQRNTISQQAQAVLQLKREAEPQAAMLSTLDPTKVQQIMMLDRQMRDALIKIMAAAKSSDPVVRDAALRAVAIFQTVARSRQATRAAASGPLVSGIAISGDGVAVGCGDCGGTCDEVGGVRSQKIYDRGKYLGRIHSTFQDNEYLYTVHPSRSDHTVFEGSSPTMRGALDTAKAVLKNVRVSGEPSIAEAAHVSGSQYEVTARDEEGATKHKYLESGYVNAHLLARQLGRLRRYPNVDVTKIAGEIGAKHEPGKKYMVVVHQGPLGGGYGEWKPAKRPAEQYAREAVSAAHGTIASVFGPESEFPISTWKNRDGRVIKMKVAGRTYLDDEELELGDEGATIMAGDVSGCPDAPVSGCPLSVSGDEYELARRAPRKPQESIASYLRRTGRSDLAGKLEHAVQYRRVQNSLNQFRSLLHQHSR